jgi:hypothetical protein
MEIDTAERDVDTCRLSSRRLPQRETYPTPAGDLACSARLEYSPMKDFRETFVQFALPKDSIKAAVGDEKLPP